MGHKGKEGPKGSCSNEKASAGLPALQLTTTTTTPFNPKEVADPFELLDMCVAALQDKRGPTREHAMAALCGALEALPPLDELDSRCLTIFALCGVSIKKAAINPKEARLAYRAVGLLALTLRAGAPGLLAHAFPLLFKTVQAHDDAPTLVAALDCLAAVTFAAALDAEEAERSLKAVWAVVFPPVSRSSNSNSKASSRPTNTTSSSSSSQSQAQAVVVAAAVSAWTFLLTTVTLTDAQRKAADRAAWAATIASLARLLDADDRAVRMAAGEALAVCAELNLTQHTPRKDMDALRARASDLAAEAGGKGVAEKKLLPGHRDLFKQVAAFLDRGERPAARTVRVAKDGRGAVRVATWSKLAQLNFLRRFLAGGFLKHVQGNALFKEAFCVGADEGKMLSVAKRKQNAKAKQKELTVNRDMVWERKNVLCLPQDAAPVENRKPAEKLLQIGWH
ncbi:hypothetical protein PR202_ga06923 [Eleusine coracana subsp. coracana]|uniref:Interferon-related developmental regulator N-terminal domain-containing protein n=1 Tax=Eleusine coracana subsp. coracana TaxID=191504 RepID=A0AAV5BYK8_ELECO|nr:hypothetical protein QOZ80_2AG0106460 [Eleusine coracana subsp. coracana]GJM90623.1 hypothetical protein PR202_ga06923 [Eleusine coracana subsp. coracana]